MNSDLIPAWLPPLDRGGVRSSAAARLGGVLLVLGVHALGLYGLWQLALTDSARDLLAVIRVRLLPAAEESKPLAAPVPPVPMPPTNVVKPQRVRDVPTPLPVLAANPDAGAVAAFTVAPPVIEPGPAVAAPVVEPLIPARFNADYLHNPEPEYPMVSRRYGEEGVVRLKVKVSAAGAALEVAVAQSSGYDRLDQAAVDAVAHYRFVPARRGAQPEESTVIVPMAFELRKKGRE